MNADKNWLIRTKSNHILGPISKEKALELYRNGSIKPDDEICSGNGFWFYIREDDMVKRYLIGNEAQNFNPISEAKDVLTVSNHQPQTPDDITLVGKLNPTLAEKAPAPTPVTKVAEISSPSIVLPKKPIAQKKSEPAAAPPKGAAPKPQAARRAPKKMQKQSYLFVVSFVGLVTLFLLLYFRKTIIRQIFQGEVTSLPSIMGEAHAQEVSPEKKKSSSSAP